MANLLSRSDAQREVNILASINSSRAAELTARYSKQYPNFSDGLDYRLSDPLSDYRVRTDRVRY
jgi:hypothetical protein